MERSLRGKWLGVAINLFNSSHATMAGVQVLANDWDHAKKKAPCSHFEDAWPKPEQGAADLSSGENVQGGCHYITRTNGADPIEEPDEELFPVCFVELEEEGANQWLSQNRLMEKNRT